MELGLKLHCDIPGTCQAVKVVVNIPVPHSTARQVLLCLTVTMYRFHYACGWLGAFINNIFINNIYLVEHHIQSCQVIFTFNSTVFN